MALEMPSMRSGLEAQKKLSAKHRPAAHKMPCVDCRVGARELPRTKRRRGPCLTPGVRYCQNPWEKQPARRRSPACERPCTKHYAQDVPRWISYMVRRARNAVGDEQESTRETLASGTKDAVYETLIGRAREAAADTVGGGVRDAAHVRVARRTLGIA